MRVADDDCRRRHRSHNHLAECAVPQAGTDRVRGRERGEAVVHPGVRRRGRRTSPRPDRWRARRPPPPPTPGEAPAGRRAKAASARRRSRPHRPAAMPPKAAAPPAAAKHKAPWWKMTKDTPDADAVGGRLLKTFPGHGDFVGRIARVHPRAVDQFFVVCVRGGGGGGGAVARGGRGEGVAAPRAGRSPDAAPHPHPHQLRGRRRRGHGARRVRGAGGEGWRRRGAGGA